jgi:hypothetical protein
LVLNIADRQAWADEEALGLSETEFLILLWLAERAARGEQATDWSAQALARRVFGPGRRVLSSMSGAYERIEKSHHRAQERHHPLCEILRAAQIADQRQAGNRARRPFG